MVAIAIIIPHAYVLQTVWAQSSVTMDNLYKLSMVPQEPRFCAAEADTENWDSLFPSGLENEGPACVG